MCDGQGHNADVYLTSKGEAVLAVTGEVGARVDVSRMARPRLQLEND